MGAAYRRSDRSTELNGDPLLDLGSVNFPAKKQVAEMRQCGADQLGTTAYMYPHAADSLFTMQCHLKEESEKKVQAPGRPVPPWQNALHSGKMTNKEK